MVIAYLLGCKLSPSVRRRPSVARPQSYFFVPFESSWWRIADGTKTPCLSGNVRLDRGGTNRGSATLHHEVNQRPRPHPHGRKWRLSAVSAASGFYFHGRHEGHEEVRLRPCQRWSCSASGRKLPTATGDTNKHCLTYGIAVYILRFSTPTVTLWQEIRRR